MTGAEPASPFAPVGEPDSHSGQTCAYKPAAATDTCRKLGTWHVMWDPGTRSNSLTCDEHMTLIRSRWVYVDRHPVGPDCTMHGALWEYSNRWCVIPDDEPVLAVGRDVTHIPVEGKR